jgi:hypothetical protein
MSVSTTTPPASTAQRADHDALLRSIIAVVTNATVLTALLVYFGWKRADVQARRLGLDETLFALSTRDYLLRSVDALFLPLGIAAALGLAWLWADGRLRERLSDPRWWLPIARGVRVLRWSWVLAPALGYAIGVVAEWLQAPIVGLVAFPLSFGLGALMTAYAVDLGRDLDQQRGRAVPDGTWRTGPTRGLVAVLVLLSVFWTLTNVAVTRGIALARQVERRVETLPAVTVHSTGRLGIDAPGVTEHELASDAYRYDGLRLLHHHDATFLLVHDGWSRAGGVVLVLTDDADLRFEIVTGDVG